MAGIAHKNLTDPQLHEPKGASTADAGEVMFADGQGNTEWKPITFEDIAIQPQVVQEASESTIVIPDSFNVTGMGGTVTDTLNDATTMTENNTNVKSVAVKVGALCSRLYTLKQDFNALVDKYNTLVQALQSTGIVQ